MKPSAAKRGGSEKVLPDYDKTIRQRGGGDEYNNNKKRNYFTSAQVRAQDGKRFVARGNEPSARQAEHSGNGVKGRQPPPATQKS